MATHRICPNGHRFDPPLGDEAAPCPFCQDATLTAEPEPLATLAPGSAQPRDGSLPIVPGYEILDELGRGGMGVVYKANQMKLHRLVALKMILAGVHAGERDLARFRTEAEAIARLSHPNIVQVFEVGEHDGLPFFALEFVEGGSLEKKLDGTPLVEREAARLVEVLASAIAAAHDKGVVHRDLKPANILLARDEQAPRPGSDSSLMPKITDFGLARLDQQGQTQTGAIVGTPSYMAPEQAEGKKDIGPAADVWALGAILYELLTGRPPFKAATPLDTILQVISDDPVPPRLLQPKLSVDLDTIFLKCLNRDPVNRYASAHELAEDLRRFLADEPIRARRPGLREQGARWLRKHRRSVTLAFATALISTVLVVAGLLALASYSDSFNGLLELTTDGPTLTAEVFGGNLSKPTRFTIPTTEPEPLEEGDYDVRVQKPGSLSETWRVTIDRGGRHRFAVRLDERALWPAIPRLPLRTQIERLTHAGRSDLILFEVDGRQMRYIDGRTGQPRWTRAITQATVPPGRNANVWHGLLWWGGFDLPPGLLEPAVDVDEDGMGDLVWASRYIPSLAVLSGSSGATLWWYRAAPPVSLDIDPARVRFAADFGGTTGGRVIGVPDVIGRGKKTEFIATFSTPDEVFEIAGQPGQRSTGPRHWVERICTGNDQPRWRYEIDSSLFRADIGAFYPARLVVVDGRTLAVVVVGRWIVGLDAETGKPVWPAFDLGLIPVHPPVFATMTNDGDTGMLLVGHRGPREELVAFSLRSARVLWESTLSLGYSGNFNTFSTIAPVLTGDGAVFARTWKRVGNSVRIGLRSIELSTGETRWETPSGENVPTSFSPQGHRLRVLTGVDLNGDGTPDGIVAFMERSVRTERKEMLFVYALSGADGRTLWWWREPMADSSLTIGPLLWWQPGADGSRQLVVPTRISPPLVQQQPCHSYVLNTATGSLAHLLHDISDPQSADLDGDGLQDLVYTYTARRYNPSYAGFREPGAALTVEQQIQVGSVRGLPAESWRRLGAWYPIQDADGDGVPDLVRFLVNANDQPQLRFLSGRTGELLRVGSPPKRTVRPTGPMRTALDRVFALPVPGGDLNKDGWPDLLVSASPPALRDRTRQAMPLAAFSGKGDRALWWASPSGQDPNRPRSFDSRLLFLPDRSDTGGPLILVKWVHGPHYLGGTEVLGSVELNALDGESGRVLYNVPLSTMPSTLANVNHLLPMVALDLGADKPDLVALTLNAKPNNKHRLEVRALDAGQGNERWRFVLTKVIEHGWQLRDPWPPPVAGDLDGDGKPEVIVVDQDRIHAIDGTGKPRWQRVQSGLTPGEGGKGLSPVVAKLDAGKTRQVCFSTRGSPLDVIVLSHQGQVRQKRSFKSSTPGLDEIALFGHDLDGDGQDELLFAADGKVRALRGGIAQEQEIWTWPTGLVSDDWTIVEVRPGKPPTVIVRSLWHRAIHGLDGRTGVSLWRSHLGNDSTEAGRGTLLIPEEASAQPRLLATRAGMDTISRAVMPTDGTGRYREVIEATERDYPELVWDPRLARPFPWAGDARGGIASTSWLLFLALGVTALIVPWFLIRQLFRRWRPWSLVLIVWLAILGWEFQIVYTRDLMRLGNAPWPTYLLLCLAGAALGLVMLTPVVLLGRWIWQRRWGQIVRLGMFFALVTLVIASLWLWVDSGREPGDSVTWDGWYLVFVPSYLVLAGLVMLGIIGAWLGRGMHQLLRRWRPRRR